jgi:molybdenum cofactor biosynthesis enzyme MoaA
VDELAAMKVFYVNIGGGEPMLRPDFFDLVGYAVDHKVGVKFSTNGTRLTAERPGAWRRWTTSTCRSASTVRWRDQRRRAW